MKWLVHTQIVFRTNEDIYAIIQKGQVIEFERYTERLSGEQAIKIETDDDIYYGKVIDIEDYVSPITLKSKMNDINDAIQYTKDCNQAFQLGKESAFSNQHVQIQRIEGKSNTNDFLLGIPRENVIDIKPMEHNTYLVIYAEEEHEENKV